MTVSISVERYVAIFYPLVYKVTYVFLVYKVTYFSVPDLLFEYLKNVIKMRAAVKLSWTSKKVYQRVVCVRRGLKAVQDVYHMYILSYFIR